MREVTLAEAAALAPVELRAQAMADFLAANGWAGIAPTMLAGDASFRRYYRLLDASRSVVLMDAPPPQEDVRSYVEVAEILRYLGLSAPEIYAQDGDRGFLLIEDFGRGGGAVRARNRYAGRAATRSGGGWASRSAGL